MANSDGKMDWDEVMGRPSASRASASAGRSSRSRSGSASGPGATGSRRAARRGDGGRRGARTGSGGATPKRSVGRRIGLGIVFTFLAVLIAGLGAFLYLYLTLSVPEADEVALAQTTKVYYADGTTEMGSLSQIDRTIIDTSTLPKYVGDAVVASEDRTFYTNSGIDLKGIARALVSNVTTGSRVGGSTLSQQYVERYYVGETTSYKGKVKEAVLAVKINQEQTKDQILGNYLNTIYFGRGAYGIEAASQAYFGHPAAQLSVSEAAMLAGIIPAPSAWDPAIDPDEAQQRWGRVLDLMVEDGWISQSDADAATFPQTVDPSTQGDSSMQGTTGYLIQQVRSELTGVAGLTADQVDTGGYTVVTTIDKAKQDAAVAAAETMNGVEGWNPATMHTALSAVDPTTGEIVAEYAGSDPTTQQDAVTRDIAQAGSTMKAFALMAYAEQGGSLKDTFDGSSPQTYDGLSDPVTNDGGVSYGTVDLLKATSYSINTAFVALNEKVGPAKTMQAAIDAGIPQDTNGLEPTLLNVLGFAAPHNIDISHAYATLATGGVERTPHIVRSVTGANGDAVYTADAEGRRVFDATDVSEILPALEAVMQPGGTGEKAAVLGRPVMGKTGTSDELSAQFVGAIPQLVTTVSMYQTGEDGVSAVPLTPIGGLDQFHGGDWPADVWLSFMQAATQDLPVADFDWATVSTRAPSVSPSPSSTPTPSETPTPTPTPTPEATTPSPTSTPTEESPDPSPSEPTPPPGEGSQSGQ